MIDNGIAYLVAKLVGMPLRDDSEVNIKSFFMKEVLLN